MGNKTGNGKRDRVVDKVLYEMDEVQKYVERLGYKEGGVNVAVDKVYVDKVEKVASRYIRRLMMIWTRRRSRASKGTRGGEEGGMKGIVVEIATLINAPPHHTTRATPDTLRSGTSSIIIGISSTLTMGNNWYIVYHTCF